jgi:hypothetical protein
LLQFAGDERSAISHRLVAALKQAGFNIGQCLLWLGIPVATADELTPTEIAKV